MKLVFRIPPPEQRVGGLDAAIDGLREALARRKIAVLDDIPARPDGETIVHFHGLWQPADARLAGDCKKRGIPYLVSPHGMLEPWAWRHKRWKKWPYFQLIEKGYLRRAAAILATAPAEARRLGQLLGHSRIETVPLGLTGSARPDYENARRQLGWKPHEQVLLYLSRIHVKKGLNLLLEALTKLSCPPNTRLVIVGDGEKDYVNELRRFAETNAARLPTVEWKGAVWGDARWPYFQGADLFCLPTHSENFGLAVLEACQVGTPVLTTVETPWAEQLAAPRGWIGQPTVESTKSLLAEYFAHPNRTTTQRQELAEWAWNHYDWDVLAARYEALYKGLLSRETTAMS